MYPYLEQTQSTSLKWKSVIQQIWVYVCQPWCWPDVLQSKKKTEQAYKSACPHINGPFIVAAKEQRAHEGAFQRDQEDIQHIHTCAHTHTTKYMSSRTVLKKLRYSYFTWVFFSTPL